MLTICALYKFTRLDDFEEIQGPLKIFLESLNIRGTLLLAKEGVNGTIAGDNDSIMKSLDYLQKDERLVGLEYKFSYSEKPPFKRLKVKLKKEIVTLGVSDIDPIFSSGTYVKPADWNELVNDPNVVLIDTRNNYEFEIGSFKGSINPNTETFREFPAYTKNNLEKYRGKKIAMFCTGGIRCEKSTAYLKSKGFENVFHLQGGILKYLEEVKEDESLWEGECFVFDDRVAVKHNLELGKYDQCHACRFPITDEDKEHPHYEKGASCPRCYGTKNSSQVSRYREREKQVQLAKSRGESHIGDDASKVIAKNNKYN
ncbi:rhodanese-related sulfurtransferase [Candidatus Thioglobus sp.]|uniref:oxygen-dependent tRNA uridine(34) hydroxylase TrhO n=1 Tax=Candidatus Pseudothioglobus sp. Uisw_086 TaxID=3230998 RepID=UPI0023024DD5|nr:rhodanese-related sulfurtransferase [Candidatus Thioglobus sp.]